MKIYFFVVRQGNYNNCGRDLRDVEWKIKMRI